jgi:hypothetical protein
MQAPSLKPSIAQISEPKPFDPPSPPPALTPEQSLWVECWQQAMRTPEQLLCLAQLPK